MRTVTSWRFALLALAAVIGLHRVPDARAYDLPLLNLGGTSFLDGLVSGPGLYLNSYNQVYSATRFKDGSGNRLSLPKQEIDVFATLTQTYWVTPVKVGDGWLALSAVLPIVPLVRTEDGLGGAALGAQGGVGDLFLGLAWQGEPVMGANGPVFSQRIEFDVIAPIGSYDPSRAINPGSNFFALNPHWDITYFVTPKVSVSARLHWLYNFSNDDPSVSYGPGVSTVQAGSAVHANLSIERAMAPGLWLGLNGYALEQINDTRIDGEKVSGRRERVFAIGPGALYALDEKAVLFTNVYVETGAKNRSEGFRINMRLARQF
jgi:hypothetical protein